MGASDLRRVRDLYERFARACIACGWQAYLPHTQTDPEFEKELAQTDVMEADLRELNRADVVVAYLGEPSLGTGAEIVLAMQAHKPILALHESSKPVSRFVCGLLQQYGNAETYAFSSIENATAWIGTRLARVNSERAKAVGVSGL